MQGIAGTGKTYFVQGIVERLRGQGKRVDIISKTHVASRRAGGVTADHWVRRYVLAGCPRCDVLWIDEISQLDVGLWLQITNLTYTGMRFILSGDFNQFPPLGNSFRGAPVSETAFLQSTLLHTLCSGNAVTLTSCMRSDSSLFSFYSSLIAGGSRFELSLQETVGAAKAQFTFTGDAQWNLVISHQRRIRINKTNNEREAPPGAVRLEVSGKASGGNGAQTMLLGRGSCSSVVLVRRRRELGTAASTRLPVLRMTWYIWRVSMRASLTIRRSSGSAWPMHRPTRVVRAANSKDHCDFGT